MAPHTYRFQADLDGLPSDFSELLNQYVQPVFAAAGFPPSSEHDNRRHRHRHHGQSDEKPNFQGQCSSDGKFKWNCGKRAFKDGFFSHPNFVFTTSTADGVAENGESVNVTYVNGNAGPVDLLEKADGFLVVLSLAGARLDQLDVHYSADDQELLVSGNIPEVSGLTNYTRLVSQRSTGDFSLKVTLPASAKIDENNIRAKGSNGVVRIFLPKVKNTKSNGVKVVVEEDESVDDTLEKSDGAPAAEPTDDLNDEKASLRSRTGSLVDDADTVVVNVE